MWARSRILISTGLMLAACSGGKSTGPSAGPTGLLTGALVGGNVSAVLTLTFPSSAASGLARRAPFSVVPAAHAAAAPIAITGTLAITGDGSVTLSGTYDAAANPQLTVSGGGYTITGNYTAANGQFAGGFTGPGGTSGQWTVSVGVVRVFCGTYVGPSSGFLNLTLDSSNRLFGLVGTATGAFQVAGSYNPGSNTVSAAGAGGYGSVNGNVDPSTLAAGGGWSLPDGSGGSWWASTALCSPPPAGAKLFGVWAIDPSNVFAVGDAGTILFSYNSKSWSFRHSGTTNTLRAMGGGLVVVGPGGTILQYDPRTFAWNPQSSGTTTALYGVARAPGGGFFAVGAGGKIFHYDGTSWSPQTGVPTDSTLYGIDKVPNFPYDFAVGKGGTILFYDGAKWNLQPSGTTNDLFAVAVSYFASALGTQVIAVGDHGTILVYDGTTWKAQNSGTTRTLRGVNAVRGLWAVGDSGTILSSLGGVWSSQASGTTNDLTAVGAAIENDVFAVGDKGTILHYDGTAWTKQR